MPFVLVQLTDPHLGATWSDDAGSALGTAVACVNRVLSGPPDAVIVSGDVANTPTDSEYADARAVLDGVGSPVYAIPGNHDDRAGLRRRFEFPQVADDRLYYAVDLGAARLVALDTKRPHGDGGQLDAAQLSWLDRELGGEEAKPTLIAMHHPPLVTGIPAMDEIGLPEDERNALAAIVSGHPEVSVIAAGHTHRAIVGSLGGAAVITIPSTDVQLALDLRATDMQFVAEPPCFALHVLVGGRFVSHIQPVPRS